MTLHSVFHDAVLNKVKTVAQADLVIGLASINTKASLIKQIVEQAISGVKTYYPNLKAVIINADVGRNPHIRQTLSALNSKKTPVISGRYKGRLGKGAAMSAILHAATLLNPQAIVILDSRTDSVAPNWIPGLASLILEQHIDLVKPRYSWPLPDGALSDLVFYPFTRAVWGSSLRHPAADDFAISANFAQAVLEKDVWQTEVNRFGFDIWLSTVALTEDWRVAQSALGTKNRVISQYGKQSVVHFSQSVGAMLRQVFLRRKMWPDTKTIQSIPTLTEFSPQSAPVFTPVNDCTAYIEALALGWMDYRTLWKRILFPENLVAVEYLVGQPLNRFYFPPALWAKIAYDFAVVYNRGERDPDTISASLYPLYLGRLASYWTEVAGLTGVGRAGTVSAQAVEFEEHLPYFHYRWESYLPWVDSGEER